MFKSPDLSLSVQEDLLNIAFLLKRSFEELVAKADCSQEEKEVYKSFVQGALNYIESNGLNSISQNHPEFKASIYSLPQA